MHFTEVIQEKQIASGVNRLVSCSQLHPLLLSLVKVGLRDSETTGTLQSETLTSMYDCTSSTIAY